MDDSWYRSIPKVELHVHFDGACRLESLMEMAKEDGLDVELFPYDDQEKFKELVTLTNPKDSLIDFLKPFARINYILGTAKNIERQAMEFCENQKSHNVIYTEVRVCPFLLTNRGMTAEQALISVMDGLKKGEEKYGIKVRLIISFLKPNPEWSLDLVDFAIKYKDRGIVGVDVAGDELKPMHENHLAAFKKAREAGLHVTVHAAESGPAENARQAIEDIKAKRIGHGYHVLDDQKVYQLAKDAGIHFEVCLTSSIYTNSCSAERHSVRQFIKDRVNFGLNTDDPGVIGNDITLECKESVTQFDLTPQEMIETMFNSARSCFLPAEEKESLLGTLSDLMAPFIAA